MIEFYGYDKCNTCRKAEKYLQKNNVEYKKFNITENPPSFTKLTKMLKSNDTIEVKDFRNTSGVDYRKDKLSEKLKALSEVDQLKLLASNGRYLKRPIILNGEKASIAFKDLEKINFVLGI